MDRAIVNRAERPSGRRRLDGALAVAAGVVLLFAVVGVVSAGSFVAGKVSGNSTKATATVKPATSSALVAQDLHRAQAQATAIVRQAQLAGHSIVTSANTRAQRQANAVIAGARRQAASYKASVRASVAAAPVPTAVPSTGNNTIGNTGTFVQPVVSPTAVSAVGAVGTGSGVGANTGSAVGVNVPNLSGLPASWLVVGYNATLSSGSGGIGTISVLNRSGKTFSGIATVKYKSGGSASASFSGLAPGQSLVLPLSGAHYSGGGYQIVMGGLH